MPTTQSYLLKIVRKKKELVVLQKIKRERKLETIEQHKVTTLKLGRTHGPNMKTTQSHHTKTRRTHGPKMKTTQSHHTKTRKNTWT